MKMVQLDVYVLVIHPGDGDSYVYTFRSREDAIDHLYSDVEGYWEDQFDESDPIEDYTKENAVDHYYNNADCGYYQLERETVSYTVMELQDEIAKALGLASHG
jgi:hypothetical protein